MIKSEITDIKEKTTSLIHGNGEMGNLIRNHNWASTSLGPIENWPQTLITATNIILQSPVPHAILWGREGVLVYNDGYSVIGGAKHPFLLGKKVSDAWPEITDFTSEFMEKGMKGESVSYQDQLLVLSRNNFPEEVWFDLSFSPLLDESGKPSGVLATVFETTERIGAEKRKKQAEDALKNEKQKLYNLFMNAPAAIAVISGPDLTFQFANDPYRKLVGNGRELLGKPLLEVIPELENDLIEIIKKVAFKGERFSANELPVLLDYEENGKPFKRYLNFIYEPVFENNKPNGLICFAFDVSDLVLSRKAVEESEKKMQVLADSMPQLVWTAGPDGIPDYYNRNVMNYEGIKREDGFYKWVEVLHRDDGEKTVEAWKQALEKGTIFEMEHRVKVKDKGYRWHLSRGFPVRNNEGEIIKWYGTATDIDDVKRFEEELKKAQEETLLLMERKDEFIGIASHELKTPLTTIKASLQFTQNLLEVKNYEQALLLISKTERNVNKLTGLVDDLLNVSKIQAGYLQLNLSVFSIGALFESSIEQIKNQSETHQIIFEGDLSLKLRGDKYRLEQVICNLVSNAIKYSPGADKIGLSSTMESGFIKISVSDEGIGIPAEKLPYIFDRFFRVEKTSYRYHGLGLGLHIAKEIIERHNGKIWAESILGKGSVFNFLLPVHKEIA